MLKLCECGCGEAAPIAAKTSTAQGYAKGQPMRYLAGHQGRTRTGARNPAWKGEDATYASIHDWLVANYPKTGVCEECGEDVGTGRRGTQYAFLRHPDPHTRDRDDYRELCATCHTEMDRGHRFVGRIRDPQTGRFAVA